MQIIRLNATARQSVEEFATELSYFANRLPGFVWIGRFNDGTEVEPPGFSVPSELMREYHRKKAAA